MRARPAAITATEKMRPSRRCSVELVVELGAEVAVAGGAQPTPGRRSAGGLEQELELVEPLAERPLDQLVERRAADGERERAPQQLLAVAAEHACAAPVPS